MKGKKKELVPHQRKQPRMSIHHRFPRAQGGENWRPNINQERVPLTQHKAWHTLFDGTLTPYDIAAIINAIWLDPCYRFRVEEVFGRDEE